jgi:hypothetical protein
MPGWIFEIRKADDATPETVCVAVDDVLSAKVAALQSVGGVIVDVRELSDHTLASLRMRAGDVKVL